MTRRLVLLAVLTFIAAVEVFADEPLECADLYVDTREVEVGAELEGEGGKRLQIAPVTVRIKREHFSVVSPPPGWRFLSFSAGAITRTAEDYGGRMPRAFCLHFAEPLQGLKT